MSPPIRLARPDDGPALAELRWRWRVEERGESGMERDEFTEVFAAWMSEHARSHTAWIAEIAGSPTGMAWLARVERVPGPWRWARTSGNLQSVYVVPEHRGIGTGQLLVAAALDFARAAGMQYVTVHPSEKSFPLYRRAGFSESTGLLELRWDERTPMWGTTTV